MDAQDVGIIQRLGFRSDEDNPRGISGPWDIAKGLGVHGTTVKRRIEAMQAAGVMAGLHMLPHFSLLGIQDGLFLFSFPDAGAKQRGYERMKALQAPGGPFFTARVEAFVGEQAQCVIACGAGQSLDDAVRAAADEVGAVSWTLLEQHDWPLESTVVKELDRRVLGAFYTDAIRPAEEVAREAGVTAKTVRLRMRHLIRAGMIEIFPDVAPARMRGLVPYAILTEPEPDQTGTVARALRHVLPDAFVHSRLHARRPYAWLAAADTNEIAQRLKSVRDIPGVADARVLLFEESAGCANHASMPPLGAFIEQSAAWPIAK